MNWNQDIFGYSFTRKAYGGKFGGPNFNGIGISFMRSTLIGSPIYANWVAATTNNALHEYSTWAWANGVTGPPADLKITINPLGQRGSSPMLDKMPVYAAALTGQAQIPATLVLMCGPGASFGPLSQIPWQVSWLSCAAPDVFLGYNDPNRMNSDHIKSLAYHEFGHTSHFNTVSHTYWQSNIQYIIDQEIFHPSTKPYGDGASAGAGRCAVIESWGYNVECVVSDYYYSTAASPHRLPVGPHPNYVSDPNTSSYIQALEAFDPFPSSGGDWAWIPMGVYWDLWDNNLNEQMNPVVDNISGVSPSVVFNSLSNHSEVEGVKADILSQVSPSLSSSINDLFASYGY